MGGSSDTAALCRQCGQRCCRSGGGFGDVLVADHEFERLGRRLGYPPPAVDRRTSRGRIYAVEMVNAKCPFLDHEGRCGIEGFKPLDCRLYPIVFAVRTGRIGFRRSLLCPFAMSWPPDRVADVQTQALAQLTEWSMENLAAYDELAHNKDNEAADC